METEDQLTCETSLSTSADEHCEGQKCLGPTAAISSPLENYSYYAKTVPFTGVGNGTFNVLMITCSVDGNKVTIQHLLQLINICLPYWWRCLLVTKQLFKVIIYKTA